MNRTKMPEKREAYFPTRREKDIILALHKLKAATVKKIAHEVSIDKTTCYKALTKLQLVGIVISEPMKEGGRYIARYRLTDLGGKYANGLSHLFLT